MKIVTKNLLKFNFYFTMLVLVLCLMISGNQFFSILVWCSFIFYISLKEIFNPSAKVTK